MKEIKKGSEIWEIVKHPKISYMKDSIDMDADYYFELEGGVNKHGVVRANWKPVPTESQIKEDEYIQKREATFSELKELEKDVFMGTKTQEEYDARKQQWLDYHNEYMASKEPVTE